MQDSFVANLLRLIQKMKPKKVKEDKKKKKKKKDWDVDVEDIKDDKELKRVLYPGLALPDDLQIGVNTI